MAKSRRGSKWQETRKTRSREVTMLAGGADGIEGARGVYTE